MRLGRRTRMAMIGTAALAAAALPIAGVAAPGSAEDYPDLRADAPENPIIEVGGGRLLLRFDGFVTNVGGGPLDVAGNPSAGTVRQRVRGGTPASPSWTEVASPEVRYETDDTHDHWHLMRISRYSLWNAARTAEVAPGQKVGFCLYDLEEAAGAPTTDADAYNVFSGLTTDWCQSGKPNATSLRMGVSAGWRDVYNRDLAFQWVDISGTRPGTYYLAAEADPEDQIRELDENNPLAFMGSPVTVPGFVAQAVGPVDVTPSTATTLRLSATKHGSAAQLRYRIESGPAHGALSVVTGAATPLADIVYTPNPGYHGTDSFTYTAFSATRPQFPESPAAATVTLNVGDTSPSVAISGNPAQLVAGTSAQLTATVANAAPGVVWSVNGVVGGNATVGTIDADGLYVAPAVGAPGTVYVRATSPSTGAAAEVALAIVPAPQANAAPGKPRITSLTIRRRGSRLISRSKATESGRMIFVAERGSRRIGRCARAVLPGRTATCGLRLRRSIPLNQVRVRVILRADSGLTARRTRRAAIRPAISRPVAHRTATGRRVRVTVRRPGRIVATAERAGRPIGRCSARVRRAGRMSCHIAGPGVRAGLTRIAVRFLGRDGTDITLAARNR